jgi:secreted PhoX family phosphatase
VVSTTDNAAFEKTHGWIFEVPASGKASAEPLTEMGRFVHEAVAVDPDTGIVYETEDANASGLYRFLPKRQGRLASGGALEMLAVKGQPRLDTRKRQPRGVEYEVEWVPIAQPARAHHAADRRTGDGVFMQGHLQGGAVFARLEGAWAGQGHIYVVSTNGGDASQGQVWELTPSTGRLRLLFESPGADLLNNPDNVCVSPRGGLALCEDGPNGNCVRGLTRDGRVFPFAQNNALIETETKGFRGDFRRSEVAGVTFSPDGQWLFFNIQTPGITLAVTGPWERGAL